MTQYREEMRWDDDGWYVVDVSVETGEEVEEDHVFKKGDELMLLNMPFDRDGHHATGWARFEGYSTDINGCLFPQWYPLYEGD